ncbi:MAG: hypothetical protein WBV94_04435 [Blastocatellia bacterium]
MLDQPRIIKLTCLSCGGALEITNDLERFACGYCGIEQIVERRGGIVALKPIAEAISKVQIGTDKTAAELALKRLPQEIETLRLQRQQCESQGRKQVKVLRQQRDSREARGQMEVTNRGSRTFYIAIGLGIVSLLIFIPLYIVIINIMKIDIPRGPNGLPLASSGVPSPAVIVGILVGLLIFILVSVFTYRRSSPNRDKDIKQFKESLSRELALLDKEIEKEENHLKDKITIIDLQIDELKERFMRNKTIADS